MKGTNQNVERQRRSFVRRAQEFLRDDIWLAYLQRSNGTGYQDYQQFARRYLAYAKTQGENYKAIQQVFTQLSMFDEQDNDNV